MSLHQACDTRDMPLDPDLLIRRSAFQTLAQLTVIHGPVLPWSVIYEGFEHQGQRMRFCNMPRGIFRPRQMRGGALSIKTTVPKPGKTARYDDQIASDSPYFEYCYQGKDPRAHDNRWLRAACELRAPLIYFYGVEPGLYWPIWPVFITLMDDRALTCRVAVDERRDQATPILAACMDEARAVLRREYVTAETKRRLHQGAFRERVLRAYEERCAVCNLPRRELIQAAHIIPDRDERGRPEVANGLALCSLHHSAFDANLLGIRPDTVVEISHKLLRERDGPVLERALKAFDGERLRVPRRRLLRPRADYLEMRFELFRAAM